MTPDPLALGATLYMPATRPDLRAHLFGGRIAGLRSAVVDLEDAVAAADVPLALARLAALLRAPFAPAPLVFARPRDPAMLTLIAALPGAEQLSGYVLPKVTAETWPAWLAPELAPGQLLMPTLETRKTFVAVETLRLREQLLAVRERVLAIRIGGNDLLSLLGARRPADRTAYDGPLGPLIARLAGEFVPWGFALSAPVMERYDNPTLLAEEVRRDVDHGLLTKTAIHPAQVPVIQAALAPTAAELADARAVLAVDAAAVFSSDGAMCEPATHTRWAQRIVARAALFDVARAPQPSGSPRP